MKKLDKLNIYFFVPVLFFGIAFFLDTADLDQSIFSFLGHRSIFTHSVLLPYLAYYLLIRKSDKTNTYISVVVISFFVAMGIHLSADLHPRGWQGYANIKFLGANLGGGLSFFWIAINSVVCFILASYLLKILTKKKPYLISYLVISLLIGIAYSSDEQVNEGKILFTIIIFLFASTYHVFKSKTDYLLKYIKKIDQLLNYIKTDDLLKYIKKSSSSVSKANKKRNELLFNLPKYKFKFTFFNIIKWIIIIIVLFYFGLFVVALFDIYII